MTSAVPPCVLSCARTPPRRRFVGRPRSAAHGRQRLTPLTLVTAADFSYRFHDTRGWELLRSEYGRFVELKAKVKEELQRQPPPAAGQAS